MKDLTRDNIFYTASILEYVARATKNKRADIAKKVGEDGIREIYEFADVSHCLPFAQVSAELIKKHGIEEGAYFPESSVDRPPSPTAIGKVYARLVEDAQSDPDEYPAELFRVLTSLISEWLTNYKSAFFYSPRDYIFYSYRDLIK